MLTDKKIRTLEKGLHADEAGLYLRVLASGKKSWAIRRQQHGKDTLKTIGHYPAISLAAARRLRDGVERQGIDLNDAIDTYIGKLDVRRIDLIKQLMKPLRPENSGLTLYSTRQELMELLQKMAVKYPIAANRKATRWKNFFQFCKLQGWISENPLMEMERKYIGGKEKARNRTLSNDEIQTLLKEPPIKNFGALFFILLTGLRSSEALWVLGNKKVEGIPTKTTPHKLPKSHLISWAVRKIEDVPAKHLVLSNALRRVGADWKPHDLRRTFATQLAELGAAPHIIEKLLNHKLEGVMAVYNHAQYWPERIKAQRVWDKHLIKLFRGQILNQNNPDTDR